MNILKSLLDHLKRKTSDPDDVPEGLCANCWGRYEYGGQFYEAVKNHNVDINRPHGLDVGQADENPNVGWIQDYANKHLSEIALKPAGKGLVCSKCKIVYRPI